MNNSYFSYLICFILMLVICTQAAIADNVKTPSTDQTATNSMSGLIDDSAPGWIYNGLTPYNDPNFKNGTSHAGGSGSYAAFTFDGTGVNIVGLAAPAIKVDGHTHRLGRVKVSIDGKAITDTNLQSKDVIYEFSMARVTGLQKGNHVLQIEPTEGWFVIDYIEVNNPSAQSKTPLKNNINSPVMEQIVPDGDYYIFPKNSTDKCLETVKGETVNNTAVQIFSVRPDHMQIWHVTPLDNGYKISPSSNPDVALTFGPKTKPIILWEFSNYTSQILFLIYKEPGYFQVAPASDNKLGMDVFYTRNEDGTGVGSFDFWGNTGQLWRFIPVEPKAK